MPPKPKVLTKFIWSPAGNQVNLRQQILDHQITFVSGPTGTGKTFSSIMTALELLDLSIKNGGVQHIIVSRPLVAAGKGFGFLPGDLQEKAAPFMQSIKDTIIKSEHPKMQSIIEGDGLSVVPIEVCRSLTFDDAFVFLDEAQNTTCSQMELFLTRLGPNSRMVISGDIYQKDICGPDGFSHALNLFAENPLFGKAKLSLDDIQRHGIVKEVVIAYNLDREKPKSFGG